MTVSFWCCNLAMKVDHTGYHTCSKCKKRMLPPPGKHIGGFIPEVLYFIDGAGI